jgi:MoaA/NifB/PqqE/SkfB family radical SAM enzyme
MLARFQDARQLHLEVSSLCNAECPLCPRNFHGFALNLGYTEHNMTLAECQQIFSPEFVGQLKSLLLNGNFGDMLMNPETADIVEYFRVNNPDLTVKINTNGGARNSDFWSRLAQLKCQVHFCLDGLEDTHSIYRRNTVYRTVLKNADTFIQAGGHAVWRMIRFDHNAHQIDQAKQLSKQLKFKEFVLIDQGRNTGPVFNNKKELVYVLGNYTGETDLDKKLNANQERHDKHTDFKNFSTTADAIDCVVATERSIYVNSLGEVYPCCWLGMNPLTYGRGNLWQYYANKQLKPLVKNNNALENGPEQATQWFEQVENSWHLDTVEQGKLLTCTNQCGRPCS